LVVEGDKKTKKGVKMENLIALINQFDTDGARRYWIMRLKVSNKIKVMLLNKFNVYYK
jgi:hypothetical protein